MAKSTTTSQRRKPTTGQRPPRESGPHGTTLTMRTVDHPEPEYLVRHEAEEVKRGGHRAFRRVSGFEPHVNPDKDRSLSGKARRRARQAARRLTRRAFYKGHGVASENSYNLRYECPCGFGVVSPLDDLEFMADVVAHEDEHREATS